MNYIEKGESFQHGTGTNGHLGAIKQKTKKMNLNLIITSSIKINSKWTTELNVK